ncbi:MAG: efflux RND transporter periplasmic adaptor subunit [Pseudomonadota bacterium]
MLRQCLKCVVLMSLTVLAACDEEEVVSTETPIRAIKYMTIGGTAEAERRIFSGVVEAGTTSNVAFEISGRVTSMTAKVGEAVEQGQLIAELDPEPYKLNLQQAEFTLKQAKASAEDARAKYDQQQQLWDKGFTTKTALDSAVSTLRNADGQVGIAQSQLELRERDMGLTKLEAPFAGQVATKDVEVFEEITPGQPIYTLLTEGEDEVSVSIPESLVQSLSIGQEVSVLFPPLQDAEAAGTITEISPIAQDANAFPVTVRLSGAPEGLRAGMSAQVTVSFETDATGNAFTVPIGALKGSATGPSHGLVYVYDEAAGVVRERPVQVVGVDGNTPQIIGEVQAGDIIATAGVGQMFDGMEVRLLDLDAPF